jgi:hypothetical protein
LLSYSFAESPFQIQSKKGNWNLSLSFLERKCVGVTTMTTDELLSAITAELSAIGAATDLGLISQEGERVSAILMIDDRRFCLSLEPKPADMDVSGWLSEHPRKLDQDQQLPRAR